MGMKSALAGSNSAKIIRHRGFAYLFDVAAFALSGILSFALRFDGVIPQRYVHTFEIFLCVWVAAKLGIFIACKLDRGKWRYTSSSDAIRILIANSFGSILSVVTIILAHESLNVPRTIYILDWLLSCLFTLGIRLLARVTLTGSGLQITDGGGARTLIYGAGSGAVALLSELRQNPSLMLNVVGLIDDDRSKRQLILHGKRVLGTGDSLREVVKKHRVERLLIAIPSATGPEMLRILKFAIDADVQYKTIPGLGELLHGGELGAQIRDVAVEDLLGRSPVHLDQENIHDRIAGRVIMVTGAGGSIGSELCRQIARFGPRALVGFDAAETPLFHIERELAKSFPELVFHPEIGDTTRPDHLERVMRNHKPSVLYHAAAYKHVPMMEKHVFAAVENNVFGTWQVALAAVRHRVDDFVMISTDKAVHPTSMMGATKRLAELVIHSLQKKSGTKFVAVRFGNVLGSNGSVVPIFKEQILAGGPVTVTHPEICRYFMTIPEAAQLVLQSFSMGKGGEVFVLDMGKPVKIAELARNLILLSGLQPGRDIEIRFTGMRPGEKLFEELNREDEHLYPTSHAKIRRYVSSYDRDEVEMREYINKLQSVVSAQDVSRLLQILKELIPEYEPDSKLLKRVSPLPVLPSPILVTAKLQKARVSIYS